MNNSNTKPGRFRNSKLPLLRPEMENCLSANPPYSVRTLSRFFALLTVFSVFMSAPVKAVEYHWEYGGGPYHYFPDYNTACEYERADRERRGGFRANFKVFLLGVGAQTSSCGVTGVAIYRDQKGAPIYWLCGFQTNLYFSNGTVTTNTSCQGFIRMGTECAAPKTFNSSTGNCELPSDNPKNPPGGSCSTIDKSDSNPGNIPTGSTIGNPINFITGNKVLDETDVKATGDSSLRFRRHYNSFRGYQYQRLNTPGKTAKPLPIFPFPAAGNPMLM